jgi:ATP-dependent helicase/nuclease subunit B
MPFYGRRLLMDELHFILCPDKAYARRLRRELATVGGRVGLQVGTWSELLSLAFSSCCLASLDDDWHERLETAAAALPDAFWAASLAADSDNTSLILATALRDVICAVPPGTSLPEIPESIPRRARRQLDDLRLLYAGIDHVLPQDLAHIKAIIESPVQRFIRMIRVSHDERQMELDLWQQALVERLNHDAADAGQEQCFEMYFSSPDMEVPLPLQSLHTGVFVAPAQPVVLDDSVQWLAVRDPLEEVEVVSGMIQTALATGEIESPSGIGILLPVGSDYAPLLREIFVSAGLSLSGLEVTECRRDLGRELLSHFLLVRRPESTPLMALTSLLTSPLMPWSPGRGQYFAHRLMQNGIGKLEQLAADDEGSALLALLGTVDTCADTLSAVLDEFAALLSKHSELAPHRAVVHDVIAELRAALEIGDELEWERLLDVTRPQVQSATEPGPITREGIAVFHEDEEPWRQVGQLYVLGFADGHYPCGLPVAAILADAERAVLNATGQWHFTLDGDVLERRRARFQRQLCTATTRITFLLPRYDLAGEAVAPSTTLAFMSRHFSGIGEPDELLLELDRTADCVRVVGLPDTTGA